MIKHGICRVLTATLLGLICCQAYAKIYSSPVVYSDKNISIRSSVLGSEETSFHLGDVLYLIIVLEFNPDRIRITNLNEKLLTESWRDSPWVAQSVPPQVTLDTIENGLARVEALYAFQILACPNPGVQCPGGKSYVLGDINLGLDLLDDNGRAVSTVDVNFSPSPGFVGIPSALTMIDGKLDSFNLYFPGRAFGLPISATVNSTPSLLLFIIGLLLISSMVVAPAMRTWLRHRVTTRVGILGKRWEHVLDRLQTETLEDLEFREGIRVAITWYCYDELRINPVHWTEADNITGEDSLQKLKKLYLQVSLGSAISAEQRKEVVEQLAQSFKQS